MNKQLCNFLCSVTLKKCILWRWKSHVKLSIVKTAASYNASYQKHKPTGIKIFICTGSLRILCIYFHHINSSVVNSSKIYILLFFSSTFMSCPTPIKQFMLLNMLGCVTFHLAMVELPGTTLRKKLTLLFQQLTICNSSLARG